MSPLVSPGPGMIAFVAAILVAGGLIWLPGAVQMARNGARPVTALAAHTDGPPEHHPSITVTPTRVSKVIPHGTVHAHGALVYQLRVGAADSVSFTAPAGIRVRAGDRVTISYDVETSQPVAVTDHGHNTTWNLPSTLPGPVSPLAPIATAVAALGVSLAAIGAVAAVVVDGIASGRWSDSDLMGSMTSTAIDTADLQARGHGLITNLMPLIIWPAMVALVVAVALCRRTRLPLPAMLVTVSGPS